MKDGVRPVADMLDRFNAISAQMADPGDDFDALMAEMGELQEKIDAVDGWTLDNQLEIAMDALRCPPGDSSVDQPLGRREAPRRADPAAAREARASCCSTSRPTTSTPRASSGSKSTWIDYPGNVILVTHDRYFLDNVVNWILELDRGRYYVYEGNYSTYLEKKAKRLVQEEREEAGKQKAINDELEWIRRSPKARQAKSKARIKAFDQLVQAQENRAPARAKS